MQLVEFGKKHGGRIALGAVVLVIALAVIEAPAIKRQLNAWKLLPQPERLTELYYKDHAKLPTKYTPGTPQSFSFTTHNIEYRTTNYSYTVTEQSEDGTQKQTLASDKFTLLQGAFNTSQVNITPIDLGNRVEIITTLMASGDQTGSETIHYWVTKDGEGA